MFQKKNGEWYVTVSCPECDGRGGGGTSYSLKTDGEIDIKTSPNVCPYCKGRGIIEAICCPNQ